MRQDHRRVGRVLREDDTLRYLSAGRVSARDILIGHICRVGNVSRQTAMEDLRSLEAQGYLSYSAGFVRLTAAGARRLKELRE